MKTMTFAELAAMPEGTIFWVSDPGGDGLFRKGLTENSARTNKLKFEVMDLHFAEHQYNVGDIVFANETFTTDCTFAVYEDADLDRLASLINRPATQPNAEG